MCVLRSLLLLSCAAVSNSSSKTNRREGGPVNSGTRRDDGVLSPPRFEAVSLLHRLHQGAGVSASLSSLAKANAAAATTAQSKSTSSDDPFNGDRPMWTLVGQDSDDGAGTLRTLQDLVPRAGEYKTVIILWHLDAAWVSSHSPHPRSMQALLSFRRCLFSSITISCLLCYLSHRLPFRSNSTSKTTFSTRMLGPSSRSR